MERFGRTVSRSAVALSLAGFAAAIPLVQAWAGGEVAGLDSLTAATLEQALACMEVSSAELGFDKLYAEDDTFRLAIVEGVLRDPLRLPGIQDEVRRTVSEVVATDSLPRLVSFLGALADVPEAAHASWGSFPRPSPARTVREAIDAFVSECRAVESCLEDAFGALSGEDVSYILMAAPAFWGEGDDAQDRTRKGLLHFESGAEVDTAGDLRVDPILDAAIKLDRPALTRAGERFLAAVLALEHEVRRLAPTLRGSQGVIHVPGVDGEILAVFETPWGLLIIGGEGPNRYAPHAFDDVAFVVDLGGDDVYRGRAASAVGTLRRTLSAVIDLSGDDSYDGRGIPFAVGGAVLGVSALIDGEGDDVYREDDGSLGAGFFGVGVCVDRAGRDIFDGRNLCEGAGAFGIGILASLAKETPPPGPEVEEDRAWSARLVKAPPTGATPLHHDENDVYVCQRYGQGFGSTFGVGLLVDTHGSDTYRAGGRYLHRPLLPHDFQSLSQGFAIGFRPRASGGCGILLDEEGNDVYAAEVYAQGTSYWYSFGMLYDGGGNDRYAATQYAQGAGVHLSVGTLWERGGDDIYTSRFGVTQGTGHDLSVGFLLDEGGNDYYVVSDGHGMSLTNSVGVFIDACGDDMYATVGQGQGALTWARGFAGSGVFLDLEGRDAYPRRGVGADSTVWLSAAHAVGIDLDRDVTLPSEVIPDPVLTAADSARPIEELFKTASLWEVGSAREKVRRARAALVTRPSEAIAYAVAHKLGTRDGLEYRTLLEIGKASPDSFAAQILPRLASDDDQVVRNVIALLGELKRTEARESLEALLNDERFERHCTRTIVALGTMGDHAACGAIRPFLDDSLERRRIQAIAASAALRDTAAIPALVRRLDDPWLTVRAAASSALESFGPLALEPLIDTITRARTSPTGRLAHPAIHLRTLGALCASIPDSASAEDLEARVRAERLLLATLEDAGAAPAQRAAAAEALARKGPAGENLKAYEDDRDPLVRSTIRRALRGIGR